MPASARLGREFYLRDVLEVAPELVGKYLVLAAGKGKPEHFLITEVEAYRGEEDRACHASRGKTQRTRVMYSYGGLLYLYFVYGMYWMLNIVTNVEEEPQAVLIRGAGVYKGPGILTRELGIDGSYYGEDLTTSERIWVEDSGKACKSVSGPRIGIDYAGSPWKEKPWRFIMVSR
jgi:DNA-3-methyladenine glycosylase